MSDSKEIRLLKAMREGIGLPEGVLNNKAKSDLEGFSLIIEDSLKMLEEDLKDLKQSDDYSRVFDRAIGLYEDSENLQMHIIDMIRQMMKDWNESTKEFINETVGYKML